MIVSIDYLKAPLLGLTYPDLPAVRVLHRNTLYSLKDTSLEDTALLEPSNLREELTLSLPLNLLQKLVIRLQISRYFEVARYLTGAKAGYNPKLLGATIVVVFSVMMLFLLTVFWYLKKKGEEKLTRKHILTCLGLWVLAKILLIPS